MKNFLLETTGKFQLLVPGGHLIRSNRPTVTAGGDFVSARAAIGQLTILAELRPEATDAEFQTYWTESAGDRALAIDSFLSAFGTR